MELMRLPPRNGWAFGDGPRYFPLARAIVGGLLFSTFVSLVLLHRLKALWNRTTGIPIAFP
jgi:hypothetical protein